MAGFDTPHNGPSAPDDVSPKATRFGRGLFAIYAIVYGTFVLLCAFAPGVMQHELSGISVAVWYGLALIAAAFALSLVYDWACRLLIKPSQTNSEGRL